MQNLAKILKEELQRQIAEKQGNTSSHLAWATSQDQQCLAGIIIVCSCLSPTANVSFKDAAIEEVDTHIDLPPLASSGVDRVQPDQLIWLATTILFILGMAYILGRTWVAGLRTGLTWGYGLGRFAAEAEQGLAQGDRPGP